MFAEIICRNWISEALWLWAFPLQGCECTIRPSGPSWTWGNRLVDAKKNANNTSANALLYLR